MFHFLGGGSREEADIVAGCWAQKDIVLLSCPPPELPSRWYKRSTSFHTQIILYAQLKQPHTQKQSGMQLCSLLELMNVDVTDKTKSRNKKKSHWSKIP